MKFQNLNLHYLERLIFFYSNTNQNLPNFTINLFLFKQYSKNNCFQYSFYLLSYVFYSGTVLKTVLEEIQNKMK